MVQATASEGLNLCVDVDDIADAGDLKYITDAPYSIDPCASANAWSLVNVLTVLSGGNNAIVAGDTVKGHNSNATANVAAVITVSGNWSSGDAFAYLILSSLSGNFQTSPQENIDVGNNTNLATVATAPGANSANIYTEKSIVNSNDGSLRISMPAVSSLMALWTGNAKDLSEAGRSFVKLDLYTGPGLYVPIRMVMGEANSYEQVSGNLYIPSQVGQWTTLSWNAANVAAADKNAITKIGVILSTVNAQAINCYIDGLRAESGVAQLVGNDSFRKHYIYPKIYHGSYNSTGANGLSVPIPRKGAPSYIEIQRDKSTTGGGCVYWQTKFGAGNCLRKDAIGNFGTDAILTVTDGAFTLGTNSHVNDSNDTYYFTAMWED